MKQGIPAPLDRLPDPNRLPDLDHLPLKELLRKRRALRRTLAQQPHLQPVRVALLGGSTVEEVRDLLELRLLALGLQPTFYQSAYGRYYEEAVEDNAALLAFRPEVVLVLTSVRNLDPWPGPLTREPELPHLVEAALASFRRLWRTLHDQLGCLVIQSNFELPPEAVLGNLDTVHPTGRTRFVQELNREITHAACTSAGRLLVLDICRLAAETGLRRWFDPERWFSYKVSTTPEASDAIAHALAALLAALYGRSRKVLVLDLDNTLWGGVLGDDGPEGIRLGRETAVGEAFTAFGQYCLRLRDRGILLAVCSKNEESVARQGLRHPDSVLREEHFAAIRANWQPKSDNLLALAQELNLGLESFVFLDDNPAERALIRAQLPAVAVPELGDDVALFPQTIESARYFEPVTLSPEDVARARLYQTRSLCTASAAAFASYGDYLDSLDMTAEIEPFQPIYLERIAQLTNKTNQFNLTLRRYTLAELRATLEDRASLGLYGRLSDRFGDHGLVSILLGTRRGPVLTIDLWLMSCRVFKRDLDLAMLDALAEHAHQAGCKFLRGIYQPGPKNAIVADLYLRLGFTPEPEPEPEPEADAEASPNATAFTLALANYRPANRHIRVLELVRS